jgi:hypothetical protein
MIGQTALCAGRGSLKIWQSQQRQRTAVSAGSQAETAVRATANHAENAIDDT